MPRTLIADPDEPPRRKGCTPRRATVHNLRGDVHPGPGGPFRDGQAVRAHVWGSVRQGRVVPDPRADRGFDDFEIGPPPGSGSDAPTTHFAWVDFGPQLVPTTDLEDDEV